VDLRRARFLPVHVEEKTGLMLFGPLRPDERATPWTGWIPQGEGHVILRDPQMTSANRLSAKTLRRLQGYRHFIIPSDN
jgi:hypothetical protein